MNHLEVYQFEKYVPLAEQQWLLWAKRAESLLGHSLDGEQIMDGYSLDYAYEAFEAGKLPNEYVDSIKKKHS